MFRHTHPQSIAVCLLATAALTATLCAQEPEPGILGKPAPRWIVDQWHNLPQGKKSLDVADFRGKVVYLYHFQSWCPGCHRHGFPTLTKLIEHYKKNDDVVFVAVQTAFEGHSANTPAKAVATAKRYKLTIPIGHSGSADRPSPMMRAYNAGGTPWTIIIDRAGDVRFNDFHAEPKKAISLIDNLLKQKPDAAPTSAPARFDEWKAGKMKPADAWRMLQESGEARSAGGMTPESLLEAIDELLVFAKRYPDTEFAGYALFNHGKISLRMGNYELAEKSLKQAATTPMHPQIKMMVQQLLAEASIRPGIDMPPFKAKTLGGQDFSTADLKGKVVLLDFWASWCGPCIVEMPNIKRLHEQWADKGLVIIGINLDDDPRVLQDFVKQNDMPWMHIHNGQHPRGQDIAAKYAINPIPNGILIGRDGKIIRNMLRGQELAELVRVAMTTGDEKPPATQPATAAPQGG